MKVKELYFNSMSCQSSSLHKAHSANVFGCAYALASLAPSTRHNPIRSIYWAVNIIPASPAFLCVFQPPVFLYLYCTCRVNHTYFFIKLTGVVFSFEKGQDKEW